MKKISIIAFLIVYSASFCNTAFSQLVASDFKKLDWITGTWKRTNAKEGQSGYERWGKLSETEWQGIGITMQGKDTSSVEKLKIIVKNKYIYYVADIRGNPEPVWYRFTEITNDGFACENLEYDFPKRIEYRKNGNRIKATISGDGKFIDNLFKKQKE